MGPGQKPGWLVSPEPLHCEVQRQLPPEAQDVLTQHLMSSGVPGHAFEMKEPPSLEQEEVEMQTPGAPPAPVQGPLTEERGARALTKLVESNVAKKRALKECILRKIDRK